MKKITKGTFLLAAGLSCLLFTGCPNLFGGGGGTTNPPVSKPTKATELIKFNLKDAKALGSVDKTATARSASRAVDSEAEENSNLLKYDEEGKASSVIEDANTEYKLDYSTLNPILEIKKNPYSDIPEAAKGVYTLFEKINYELKYTDGSVAPNLGQLIYTKPDGSVVDVSDYDKLIYIFGAEYYGYDYIEFANDGKAYFITDGDLSYHTGGKIFCFDPATETTKEIELGLSGEYKITDFRINDDGSWMFVATSEEVELINDGKEGIKHLYAVPTANPSAKIELYKQATDEKDKYTFSKITYDSTTKMMYVACGHVSHYLTNAKRFYKWNNGYSADNVEFYEPAHLYLLADWYKYYKYEKNMSDDEVFAQMAKNFKNYCDLKHSDYNPGTGSSDDIEINLSYFADKPEYAALYNADAKDGAAVKILFDNILPNGIAADGDFNGVMDYTSTFRTFLDSYNNAGNFPIELLCFLKDSEGNVTTESAYAQNKVMENWEITMLAELVSLKNGCWGFRQGQKWNGGTFEYYYSDLVQVTDANGNFVCEVPEALKGLEGYFAFGHNSEDPWFKNPFSVNEEGTAALITRDRKDIYFFDGTTVTNLLKDKEIVNSIDYIYSVSLEKDVLYFTAKGTDGNWINQGIKLSDGSFYELETTDMLTAIIGM